MDTPTLADSRSRSNDDEGVLHTPQISRTKLYNQMQFSVIPRTSLLEGLIPLLRRQSVYSKFHQQAKLLLSYHVNKKHKKADNIRPEFINSQITTIRSSSKITQLIFILDLT